MPVDDFNSVFVNTSLHSGARGKVKLVCRELLTINCHMCQPDSQIGEQHSDLTLLKRSQLLAMQLWPNVLWPITATVVCLRLRYAETNNHPGTLRGHSTQSGLPHCIDVDPHKRVPYIKAAVSIAAHNCIAC